MAGVIDNIRNKIKALREQPEQARYRTVSYFTMATATVVGILWLVVLLPAQIYFAKEDRNSDAGSKELDSRAQAEKPSEKVETETIRGEESKNVEAVPRAFQAPIMTPSNQPTVTPPTL